MGDCSRIYPRPTRPSADDLGVRLRNAAAAWRYAFQKPQEAVFARIGPLVQLTSDPTDVEVADYGITIGVGPDDEHAVVAARVSESAEELSAEELSAALGNFVLGGLLGTPTWSGEAFASVRLSDDEFYPLIREGCWFVTASGDALADQVVTLPPGERLAGDPKGMAFETALLEAYSRARGNARACGLRFSGLTLVASHQAEQRIRSAFTPRWGVSTIGLDRPLGIPEPCHAWFTPAIPHPDVAFLVPHVEPDRRPFEIVLQDQPSLSEQVVDGCGMLYVQARLGFRLHRAPWVMKITSEDAEGGGAVCR